MGVCKRLKSEIARIYIATCCSLCADACLEFFLGWLVYIGVCKLLESEVARIYVPSCCCCKGTEWQKEKKRGRGKKSGLCYLSMLSFANMSQVDLHLPGLVALTKIPQVNLQRREGRVNLHMLLCLGCLQLLTFHTSTLHRDLLACRKSTCRE